jgi:Ca2+:H+ antiporter
LLVVYMVPVVFLAEHLAHAGGLRDRDPECAGGVGRVGDRVLVATPEAIGATKAAFHNQLQRS